MYTGSIKFITLFIGVVIQVNGVVPGWGAVQLISPSQSISQSLREGVSNKILVALPFLEIDQLLSAHRFLWSEKVGRSKKNLWAPQRIWLGIYST